MILSLRRATLSDFAARRAPVGDSVMEAINRYAAEPLKADDVHTREAMICNDQIDHYRTRFLVRALDQIAVLVPGVNLMRNHNEYASGDLPMGRFYRAERVRENGTEWVRGSFYYMRGPVGDEMDRQIAGGVWNQVSVSWWMRSFTSSGDGKPMDQTQYPIGSKLPDGTEAVGLMDDVCEVNEVSLVARGGQVGTSIRSATKDDVLELVEMSRARRDQETKVRERFRFWTGR